MTRGRVVVVGLGPAGDDLLLPAARRVLGRAPRCYVRTARHPAVDQLAAHGLEIESFDHRYDAAEEYREVYDGIADDLVHAAAQHGEVCYAVPGNPGVGEQSVEVLRRRAAAGEIDLTIVPGLSYVDLAWAHLGVDPMAGARVADAQSIAADAAGCSGPLLVGHTTTRLVLSDVKLTLLDRLGPDHPVTVLHHLGLPDEQVLTMPLAELDRGFEPDHLTSVFVDLGMPAAGPTGDLATDVADAMAGLVTLALRLRAPGGCPWDAAQSHHSLTRYLLEEAYEVVEAVEALPAEAPAGPVDARAYGALEDELGDLLYQVVFHAVLAGEAGAFTLADVIGRIHEKLVRRHPHVFGDEVAGDADAVTATWEQIKKAEKGASSLVEDISPGLPSLLYAHKLARKAAAVGLDPGGEADGLDRIAAALELLRTGDRDDTEQRLGELLAACVVVARARGVDAESALRGWAARYRDQFMAMERLAADAGIDLHRADRAEVARLWSAAPARGSISS